MLQVRADSLNLEGESVSRIASGEVLCRGLFPGEVGTLHIDAVSAHHARAFASLRSLDQAHPARREPPCPNHEARGGACGGCALMALDENAQRELKRAMLRERFGLEVASVEAASPELGYRFSSKRVALRVAGQLVLGSFARASHAPAPMPGCLVDHPRIEAAFAELERVARALAIEPYDETSDQGDLRAAWAKTDGARVIVSLVVRSAQSRAAQLVPEQLSAVDGVLVSVQDQPGNQLRGASASLRCGQPEVSLALLGHAVEVGALGFLQPNPRAAEAAYRALLEPISDAPHAARSHQRAFDLYAGAGVTTRALRERYREVSASEAHPESAARLGIEPASVELFLARELALPEQRPVDLIIANPPRKGLGPQVGSQLLQVGAQELRIMSCGPEGLARDLRALCVPGGYTLRSLRAFDTLPQTPHVELVARLERAAADA